MATYRKRTKKDGTDVIQAQVRMTGYPSRTATFRTRRAAERWAKTVEAEMIEGKHFRSVEARRRTLADAVDRYLREVAPRKRDSSTATRTLGYWKAELGHLRLSEISPALIVERRDKLANGTFVRAKPGSARSEVRAGEEKRYPRRPATVNRYLANLGHLFTIARKEWHWISHNPMDGVSRFRESRGRVRYLSDRERVALLKQTAQDETLHAFVVVALSTACRAGELQKLTWADVDLKKGRLLFRETKNAEPRTVWILGEALELMRARDKVEHEQDDRVFPGKKRGVYDYGPGFSAALERAGIEDFRFHDLRHTAATYLAQQGATEQQLKAIGGWKSSIVSRYVHLAAQDAKAPLEGLSKRIAGGKSQ